MTADWQSITALACVALAAIALTRRTYRWWRGTGDAGCGAGCGDCPSSESDRGSAGFVALEDIARTKRRQ